MLGVGGSCIRFLGRVFPLEPGRTRCPSVTPGEALLGGRLFADPRDPCVGLAFPLTFSLARALLLISQFPFGQKPGWRGLGFVLRPPRDERSALNLNVSCCWACLLLRSCFTGGGRPECRCAYRAAQ